MEFNEKLQTLRKSKGLTQEQLAQSLYVSRTAVSKWEAGKGFPNIDSLKQLSKLFGVSIDGLLSADELLTVAEADNIETQNKIRTTVFSMLDANCGLLWFLPFFAQRHSNAVQAVSLLALTTTVPCLKTVFFAVTAAITAYGILTLVFSGCHQPLGNKNKFTVSLLLNTAAVILFIVTNQPYAAVFIFCFLVIKAAMLIKLQ